MRTLFFLNIFLIIQFSLPAQQKWLNPTPAGWINTKIHFVNNHTGYLMNRNGELFASSDTGNTWHDHGHFPGAQFFQIKGSTGIIPCLDSSIYLSADSGTTWLKSKSSPGNGLYNNWCDIVGRDTLFVLKYINNFVLSLHKSVDRGETWQLINDNINQFYFNSIDFITSKTGFALKPDGIFKTSDGGISWQELYNVTTSANVTCLKFYDTLTGLAYRESYGILRTTDGGVSWVLSNQVADDINDIFYVDADTVYASGDDGVVYKSVDGGTNWAWVGPSGRIDAYDLYSQYFFDGNHGMVTGHRGRLLRTRNGGESWEWYSPTYIDVTGISFVGATTGYASTWNNLYKTTDSGKTWTELTLSATGFNTRFEHCRFTADDTGFVTTTFPARVHRTVDGGQNWTTYTFATPGTYDNISSMSFYHKDSGYISLRGGSTSLHKTTNGGNSWQPIENLQNLNLLYFINDTFGYATVYDRIYRTANGGLNWTAIAPPVDRPYKAIWFTSASKGFAIADGGQLQMTLDSGYHWNNIFLDPFTLPDFSAIAFYNDKIGYITDDEGRYYKTIDSGYHWKQNGTVAFYECPSILFWPDSTVLFAGMYGSIVSRSIAEYSIDSIQVIPAACGAELRARISAFLSPVDSVWFEYGKHGYTAIATGNPVRVADTSLRIVSHIIGLDPDSLYHFRVRLLFKGKYYYSTDFVFVPKKAVAPVITASGNILSSSATSGNQWYLNGVIIAGATGQQHTATTSGAYTVTAVENECPTPISSVYNLTITGLPDVDQADNEIRIFPNPVHSGELTIMISNNRNLSIQVLDISGRLVLQQTLQNGNNKILVQHLPAGIYVLVVSDARSFKKFQRKILKL